jgi:ribosomal protein L37E
MYVMSSPPDVQASVPLIARVADAVGADGKIQVDLPCRRCGYNLRSLARDARCPECGFPVIRCLRRDDLGYGDPRYVRRIALGAYLIFGASIAAVATMFLFGALGVGGRLAAYALAAVAAWLVTTPDPSGIGEAEYGLTRRAARMLVPLGLLGAPLSIVYRTTANPAVIAIANLLIVCAWSVAFVGLLMLARYLQCVAIRAGSTDAVRELTRSFRGIALSVPPLAVVYFLKVRYNTLPSHAAMAVAVVASAAIMGLMFTMVSTIAGTWTLARELKAEATIARQLWPRDGAKRDGVG